MKRFAALLALLLIASPCSADVTALLLGSQKVAASTNVLTTSTNDCPPRSLIVLGSDYTTIADTLSSVVDSAGNTWQTPFDNITTTGLGIGIAYAKNTTVDLPIGGTVTATFVGSTANSVVVICVANADPIAPLDTSNHSAAGASGTTATTVNTGTLSNATEMVIGLIGTAVASGATTCNGSYTRIGGVIGVAPSISFCTLTTASTGSQAFAPSWTNSSIYLSDVVSFQGVSVKSAAMTLTGVGP